MTTIRREFQKQAKALTLLAITLAFDLARSLLFLGLLVLGMNIERMRNNAFVHHVPAQIAVPRYRAKAKPQQKARPRKGKGQKLPPKS